MAKDYSMYGNYDPPTQKVDTRTFMPTGWVDFINPHEEKIESNVSEDHYCYYTTLRTVQPTFDFVPQGKYPITFVIKFTGFEEPVTRDTYQGERIDIPNWMVELSIQVQHGAPETMKAMKEANNSIGLSDVHNELIESDFFETLSTDIPNFEAYNKAGKSESYGKAYRLGKIKFENQKFEEIKPDLLNLFSIVSGIMGDFSSTTVRIKESGPPRTYGILDEFFI
jgi:hypothetical protein